MLYDTVSKNIMGIKETERSSCYRQSKMEFDFQSTSRLEEFAEFVMRLDPKVLSNPMFVLEDNNEKAVVGKKPPKQGEELSYKGHLRLKRGEAPADIALNVITCDINQGINLESQRVKVAGIIFPGARIHASCVFDFCPETPKATLRVEGDLNPSWFLTLTGIPNMLPSQEEIDEQSKIVIKQIAEYFDEYRKIKANSKTSQGFQLSYT